MVIRMKNLILNPYLLYLADTQKIQYSGMIEYPKIRMVPQRKQVAVLEVSNHFFELEKIKGHGIFLGKELPIHESDKEFIDITTFQKFPYERSFDFDHANLDSLRKAYRKYRIMELGDVSNFGIQKLYRGKVSIKDSSSFKNFVIFESDASFPKIDTYLLQLEGNRVMILRDFLEGKGLNSSFSLTDKKNQDLTFEFTEEIPLEELKEISISYSEEGKKKAKF